MNSGIAQTGALRLPPSPPPASPKDLADAQESFRTMFGRHTQSEQTQGERARTAAEQFVAQTFVQPILKQFRESDRSPPPFAPSQGEKQFRALMDAELAQRIVEAQEFPLVDRVARDLLKRGGGTAGIVAGMREDL